MTNGRQTWIIDPYAQFLSAIGIEIGREDFDKRRKNELRGLESPDPDRENYPLAAMSRRHARVRWRDEAISIEDGTLDRPSTHGTFLDGRRLVQETIIPEAELGKATVYFGAPCFCLRFAKVTQVMVTIGDSTLESRSLPAGFAIHQMVLGYCKKSELKANLLIALPEVYDPKALERWHELLQALDIKPPRR